MTRSEILLELEEEWADCDRCSFSKSRKNVVFGRGSHKARIMAISEKPGVDEDKAGLPFEGPVGDLLFGILNLVGIPDQEVYVTNVVCCIPPREREPGRKELEACSARLLRQIEIVDPLVITTMGKIPTDALLHGGGALRGRVGEVFMAPFAGKVTPYSRPLIPNWNPAFLMKKSVIKSNGDIGFDGNEAPQFINAWRKVRHIWAELMLEYEGITVPSPKEITQEVYS